MQIHTCFVSIVLVLQTQLISVVVFVLQDVLDCIVDLREHDIPYHIRYAIDTDVRCGHWFTVKCKVSSGQCL